MTSGDKIKPITKAEITEFDGDKSKMGQIISVVLKETNRQVDGSYVKKVAMELPE